MQYIHPESQDIKEFVKELKIERLTLEKTVAKLLQWFDENVAYSRFNAPYAPLQRSDIDVLEMKSGTCGDYANLIVSVLTSLGYPVQYAYLKTDCYGNPQDHICAAVWEDNRWKLIDATLPYRKWQGFDCLHQEYELFPPQAFEEKMKKEEAFWTRCALDWDDAQWSVEYSAEAVPDNFKTEQFWKMSECIRENVPIIEEIVRAIES